jgi:hypothetical protein
MKDPADGNSVFIEAMDLELGSLESKKMNYTEFHEVDIEYFLCVPLSFSANLCDIGFLK